MTDLPDAIQRSALARRARVAVDVAEAVGAALRRVRSAKHSAEEIGDQLKTGVDRAAEGWVVGYLQGCFADEAILSEEAFEDAGVSWSAPTSFWTVDALDGTRSFIDGFEGFCVQLAWVERGSVLVGVVHEPVHDRTYVGVKGAGAYRIDAGAEARALKLDALNAWPSQPTFVDSTRPADAIGAMFDRHAGQFLELGSIGLKICRVADASAHLFVKRLRFKLWDVAPAQVILAEAGAEVGLWDGSAIPYDTDRVVFQNILAAPRGLFALAAEELRSQGAV